MDKRRILPFPEGEKKTSADDRAVLGPSVSSVPNTAPIDPSLFTSGVLCLIDPPNKIQVQLIHEWTEAATLTCRTEQTWHCPQEPMVLPPCPSPSDVQKCAQMLLSALEGKIKNLSLPKNGKLTEAKIVTLLFDANSRFPKQATLAVPGALFAAQANLFAIRSFLNTQYRPVLLPLIKGNHSYDH